MNIYAEGRAETEGGGQESEKTNGTDWFPAAAWRQLPGFRGGPGFVTGGRKRSRPLITQLKWTGNHGSPVDVGLDDGHQTRRQRYYYRPTINATTGVIERRRGEILVVRGIRVKRNRSIYRSLEEERNLFLSLFFQRLYFSHMKIFHTRRIIWDAFNCFEVIFVIRYIISLLGRKYW